MSSFVVSHHTSQAFFRACEEEPGSINPSTLIIHRIDVPPGAVALVVFFAPVSHYWGIPYRHAAILRDWDDELPTRPSFATAVERLLLSVYPTLDAVPAEIVRFDCIGAEGNTAIGSGATLDLGRRAQALWMPLDESRIAAGIAHFNRYVEQLGRYALLPTAPETDGDVANWRERIHPRLQALFALDHGRGIFGEETSTASLKALEQALAETSSEEATRWLTPRCLAEEFVRFRYPIGMPRTNARRRTDTLFGLLADATEFPDLPARVALLRARLLRKWGWPTWLNYLRLTSEPSSHAAMLAGKPPWPELEGEVAAILQAARNRFPVIFE